ncbi:hypothetical protein KFZ70_09565 [Tamlana fucoidanivorans]|uniref:Glycoside hydrolase family 18 protein n=1 Tax=Allotamlana fucoidanivorans TaxID=2583814 RepID=A0A5C4SPU3_9FLAO|nr:hypothetical protein [Tamlana fucoidanivorans]TNJ46003.1 hypothetical protein FGF67_03120 [Tamlana fucoidanivorans]
MRGFFKLGCKKIIVLAAVFVTFSFNKTDNLVSFYPQKDVDKAEVKKYAGNLKDVFGDVKQAQIGNSLSTTTEVDNLLIGFETLGVNGIRITIFPEGENPNEEIFDYLYTHAKSKGFKIMANPALWDGAVRIANKVLHGTRLDFNSQKNIGPNSTLGNDEATNIVIERIKTFANKYKVDLITPFNEDGEPGKKWSVVQMNKIYRELHNNVNGAELMGPCTWGIPGGTKVLMQTDILQYISIASTHNLGFNHKSWREFQHLAGDLPVWDSEVNNTVKYSDKATRIDAALKVGVNGLVLYDSWKYISLIDGSINKAGNIVKSKILAD